MWSEYIPKPRSCHWYYDMYAYPRPSAVCSASFTNMAKSHTEAAHFSTSQGFLGVDLYRAVWELVRAAVMPLILRLCKQSTNLHLSHNFSDSIKAATFDILSKLAQGWVHSKQISDPLQNSVAVTRQTKLYTLTVDGDNTLLCPTINVSQGLLGS